MYYVIQCRFSEFLIQLCIENAFVLCPCRYITTMCSKIAFFLVRAEIFLSLVPGVSCRAIFWVREEIQIFGDIFTSELQPLLQNNICHIVCVLVLCHCQPNCMFMYFDGNMLKLLFDKNLYLILGKVHYERNNGDPVSRPGFPRSARVGVYPCLVQWFFFPSDNGGLFRKAHSNDILTITMVKHDSEMVY